MLDVLGFELLESGSLFGDENPQHYYIARPRNPLAAIENNAVRASASGLLVN